MKAIRDQQKGSWEGGVKTKGGPRRRPMGGRCHHHTGRLFLEEGGLQKRLGCARVEVILLQMFNGDGISGFERICRVGREERFILTPAFQHPRHGSLLGGGASSLQWRGREVRE